MKRRSSRRLLAIGSVLFVVAGWLTGTMRAGDNLDFENGGQIRDIFWDSRLFDGTPGFPGAIRWFHNPSGMPVGLDRGAFEASIEAAFDAWEAVDNGIPGEPLVPVVSFGGETNVTDPYALDGVNTIAWKAEASGGTLVTTPCWALTEPTTTIDDGTGKALMPVSGGGSIPFPGPSGVTYPIGTIIDCGMRFDSLDAWSTSPNFLQVDVQSIATHEGGHFIGMSHSTLGNFAAVDTANATMLPFAAYGDTTFRTLEEDDKASVLRTYARNRASGPITQTVGGRGVIAFTLLKGAACEPASGLSVVAYPTAGGTAGPNRIETFSGSQLRAGIADEPSPGSVRLNVPPLTGGSSYTVYARTLELGVGPLSAQRYNYTTIRSNLLDPENKSRTFDQLATVAGIGAGQSVDIGSIGILGCWVPDPTSAINLAAASFTAPATAIKGSQIAVTSSFTNQGSGASGPFEVGVYFSTDQTINADDVFAGLVCSVTDLASGATRTCNGSVNVPGVVPGNYYVGLLVDRQNQVIESVENDNGLSAGHLTTVEPNPYDPIVNGSFETGDLTGWTVKELTPASNPSLPLGVDGAGVEYPAPTFYAFPYILDYFASAPTDGQYAALNDFNGDDPATSGANQYVNRRELYQDITLPAGTTTLEFDYRAAWELFRFGSTQDRTFDVEIEPAGGGQTLLRETILTALNGTIEEDTDNPTGGVGDYPPASIDLNAFAGQSVRLKFVWNIPEPGTGFAFFQLDNIRLNTNPVDPPADVDNLATADFATALGTVGSGTSFRDTWVEDNVYEKLTEALQGGNPSRRRSLLDHRWTFSVAPGAQYVFKVNAHHSGTEDNFAFAYSRDNVSYTSMLVVSETTDNNLQQTYLFPEDVRGTVYVRVQDTDNTQGRSQLDSLFVDSMAITTVVGAGGTTPPTVTITAPSDGSAFTEDDTITFAGTATDAEDGNISANLSWSSNVDGSIGSGASVSTSVLSVGPHTITASVTDSSGRQGARSIAITVTSTSGGNFTLSAVGYKVKGVKHADLSWSGATTSSVTVRRDGVVIATVPNSGTGAGAYTDTIGGKGSGTYVYQVCGSPAGACSNLASVTF